MKSKYKDIVFLITGLAAAVAFLTFINSTPTLENDKIFTDKLVSTDNYIHQPIHKVSINKHEKSWPGLL